MNTQEFINQLNALNTVKVQYVQMLLKELLMKHLTTTCVEQTVLSAALKESLVQDLQRIYPAVKEQKVNGRSLVEWTAILTASRGQPVGLLPKEEHALNELQRDKELYRKQNKPFPVVRQKKLDQLTDRKFDEQEEKEALETFPPTSDRPAESYLPNGDRQARLESYRPNGEKKAQRDDDRDFYVDLVKIVVPMVTAGSSVAVIKYLQGCIRNPDSCYGIASWLGTKICGEAIDGIKKVAADFFRDKKTKTAPVEIIETALKRLNKKVIKILKEEELFEEELFEENIEKLLTKYGELKVSDKSYSEIKKLIDAELKEANKETIKGLITSTIAATKTIFSEEKENNNILELIKKLPKQVMTERALIKDFIKKIDPQNDVKDIDEKLTEIATKYNEQKQEIYTAVEQIRKMITKNKNANLINNLSVLNDIDKFKKDVGVPESDETLQSALSEIFTAYTRQIKKDDQSLFSQWSAVEKSDFDLASKVLAYMRSNPLSSAVQRP